MCLCRLLTPCQIPLAKMRARKYQPRRRVSRFYGLRLDCIHILLDSSGFVGRIAKSILSWIDFNMQSQLPRCKTLFLCPRNVEPALLTTKISRRVARSLESSIHRTLGSDFISAVEERERSRNSNRFLILSIRGLRGCD